MGTSLRKKRKAFKNAFEKTAAATALPSCQVDFAFRSSRVVASCPSIGYMVQDMFPRRVTKMPLAPAPFSAAPEILASYLGFITERSRKCPERMEDGYCERIHWLGLHECDRSASNRAGTNHTHSVSLCFPLPSYYQPK